MAKEGFGDTGNRHKDHNDKHTNTMLDKALLEGENLEKNWRRDEREQIEIREKSAGDKHYAVRGQSVRLT